MNASRRRPWLWRLCRLSGLLGAFAILWACNAPFIPVPPPGASFTSALVDDGAGGQKTVWVTHGLPSGQAALARYFVFDEATGHGTITTAGIDGTFTSDPMDGTLNDHIRLYYQTPNGDYSESICLLLTTDVGSSGSAPGCPP
jgi:hypothetical protein